MTAVVAQQHARPRALPGLPADLLATAAFGLAVGQPGHPVMIWVVLGYLVLWPGDLLRRGLGVVVTSFAERLVYAVGASLTVLIGLTVVVEGLSLLVGVGRPFAHGPLVWGALAVCALLVLVGHREGAAPAGPWVPETRVWVLGTVSAAALLAIGGAKLVDNGHGPALSLVAFGVLAGIGALSLLRSRHGDRQADGDLAAVVVGLGVAVAWSFSMRTPYLFGYDLHQELATVTRTLHADVWRPRSGDAYNASLSLSSVPTGLVTLSGISPVLLMKLLYPMFLGVLPGAAFVLLRRLATPLSATALTVLIVLNPVGYWQVAVISRQELAFGIFAALLLLLLSGSAATGPRNALALVLGVGCVLAHYSTSYVAIALLLGVVSLTWLARLWSRLPLPDRAVPWWLPLTMLAVAFVWGHVLNQSTQNVDQTARTAASQAGLRQSGSWLDTWLKGGLGSAAVEPREFFEAAKPIAATRPWLRGYSQGVQAQFPARSAPAEVARPPAPQLAGPFDLGFTILRQGVNLAAGLGGFWLALLVVRRRVPQDVVPLIGFVGSALTLAVVVRLNVGLASAYNAERLVVQLGPLLALGVVLAWRHRPGARSERGGAGQRAPAHLAGALVAVVVLVAGLIDTTGIRGVVTGWTAGNLVAHDEYAQRYWETDQDAAAADWLVSRFGFTNQVYADRYGALFLRDHPAMRSGTFDTLLPALLDQRAYVFATTENVVHGRVRGQIGAATATYAFPRTFFETYKTVAYDNGSARVYD